MDLLVVATADWDNPLWTNKQHLSARWGASGHRVLYLESLGLRRPGVSGRDLGRMWRRLRRANRVRLRAPGVWVASPLVIPLHRSAFVRRVNRVLLARLVRRALLRIGMQRPVVWTYHPLALEYVGDLERAALVYHCVDELAGAPGMPSDLVEAAEEELCRRADLVVVTAPTLLEGRRRVAKRLEYVPNVADFASFHRATEEATQVPEDILHIPVPRLGFFGAINNYKLDLELLEGVARARPEWSLVLIGPVGAGEPGTRVDALRTLPNVHLLGTRPRGSLPGYLKGFDVCLLPNRLNRYTRHMFPLKFFEYLAAGKPVAMTDLPALREYTELACVSEDETVDSFVGAIERALAEEHHAEIRQRRIEEARRHDWDHQARRLSALVFAQEGPADVRAPGETSAAGAST